MISGSLAPSTMMEVVTSIWEKVLRRTSIGIEENFFDLGGDSSSAIEICREIKEQCGRELSPVLICQAPTIKALLNLLLQSAPSRAPALIQLKPGTKTPPIFIAHGLGNTVMELVQLARHIRFPHPVFGLQSKGVDGIDEPFGSIEQMAQYQIEAIRQMQPQGPYFLIGYSLGGLVALEIARRLSENGEKIALLAMLDSYSHRRYLPPAQRVRLILRLIQRRIVTEMQLLRYRHQSPTSGNQIGSDKFSLTMQHIQDSDYLALKRYQPRFYPGKIRFVRASTSSFFPDDPVAAWARFAKEFEVETIPGDHMEMLTTNSENLALIVSRYLREASLK